MKRGVLLGLAGTAVVAASVFEDLPGIVAISHKGDAAELRIPTEPGPYYQIEASADGVEWSSFGLPIKGRGEVVHLEVRVHPSDRAFYRVRKAWSLDEGDDPALWVAKVQWLLRDLPLIAEPLEGRSTTKE